MRSGGVVTDLLDEFDVRAEQLRAVDGLATFGARLVDAVAVTRTATTILIGRSGSDPRSVFAASAAYLRMLGTTVCAGLLAKSALTASGVDDDFHRAKVVAARYFGEQILPTVGGLLAAIEATADDTYALSYSQLR